MSSAPNSPDAQHPLTIFFKVKGRVKKASFSGSSIEDLNKTFLDRFPEFPPFSIRPFTVMHPDVKVGHEVEEVEDLYPNCVLEMSQDSEAQGEQAMNKRSATGLAERDKTVLVMVGLPARGKTFIASKICHLLNWMGITAKMFNVGEYRRATAGAHKPAEFFDPNNAEGQRILLHCALAALDDMMLWLGQGGHVAVFDAANIRADRRKLVLTRCQREGVSRVIFIESVCDDMSVIEENIREAKMSSPDYLPFSDPAAAVADLQLRISHYVQTYETVADSENVPYIKLFDGGRRFELLRITGYLPSRLVFFLMNLHISPRTIWITRAGECTHQTEGRIGGDSDLTKDGEEYAHRLAAWVEENTPKNSDGTSQNDLVVWTSTLRRSVRSAQYLPHPKVQLRGLDDLERGVCDGLTPNSVAMQMPDEFAARASDKFSYRYPRGESYEDITQRLEPVILELERSRKPLLIVSHQAPLRCLYAYLMGVETSKCPYIPIPMHTVVALTPKAYGCDVKTYPLLPERKSIAPIDR